MDKRLTGIMAYLTIIGWIIAYLKGAREEAGFHMNQGLVIHLAFFILIGMSHVPVLRIFVGILEFVVVMLGVMGIIYASRDEDKEIPILGIFKILN